MVIYLTTVADLPRNGCHQREIGRALTTVIFMGRIYGEQLGRRHFYPFAELFRGDVQENRWATS